MSTLAPTFYFCIVNTPGAELREIAAIPGRDDADAVEGMRRLALTWPGFETITLYEGERLVSVLVNPALGFAPEPMDWDQAA